MPDSHHFAIDLNADVGESLTGAPSDVDRDLMRSITSASVAAGFHAGGPTVLRETVRLARSLGVAVGAHPSFPDREHFGRREFSLPMTEVEDLVLYQVAVVAGVSAAEGVHLHHVKPHGALYNMAARDRALALAIVRAVHAFDRSLLLYAPPRSELLAVGREHGLRVVVECFADRAYEGDGSLVARAAPRSVIEDAAIVAARVIRMVKERTVETRDGALLPIDPETICIHSDTTGAAAIAAHLRSALERSGVLVRQA